MVENNIDDDFRCNKCDKKYKDKSGLWYHNKKFHSTDIHNSPQFSTIHPQFSTIHPQKSTIFQPEIKSNISNKNLCNFCDREFSRSDSLKRHNNICKNKNSEIQKLENLLVIYLAKNH